MNKKETLSIIIGAVVLAVIVVGLVLVAKNPSFVSQVGLNTLFNHSNSNTNTTPSATSTYVSPKEGIVSPVIPITSQADVLVDITSAGFSPAQVTISPGQSVLWTNRDRANHWIVSGPTAPYPGSGQCGSPFDSCQALQLGDSYKFTFSQRGIWDFYDKLNPKFTGEVTVK